MVRPLEPTSASSGRPGLSRASGRDRRSRRRRARSPSAVRMPVEVIAATGDVTTCGRLAGRGGSQRRLVFRVSQVCGQSNSVTSAPASALVTWAARGPITATRRPRGSKVVSHSSLVKRLGRESRWVPAGSGCSSRRWSITTWARRPSSRARCRWRRRSEPRPRCVGSYHRDAITGTSCASTVAGRSAPSGRPPAGTRPTVRIPSAEPRDSSGCRGRRVVLCRPSRPARL